MKNTAGLSSILLSILVTLQGEFIFTSPQVNGYFPLWEYILSKYYFTPFNPATKIRFDITSLVRRGAGVVLKVYDLLGREVATLVNEQLAPGTYEVEWNASAFASGVYFYSLNSEEFTETKKLILLK